MRIAVPTNDGLAVSEHFGRSAAFLVFDVENGEITKRETRPNGAQHVHAEGSCGQHTGETGHHNHAGILSTLAGCDVVICAGMGWRAAEALKAGGITVIAAGGGVADQVVASHLNGTLQPAGSFCKCSH